MLKKITQQHIDKEKIITTFVQRRLQAKFFYDQENKQFEGLIPPSFQVHPNHLENEVTEQFLEPRKWKCDDNACKCNFLRDSSRILKKFVRTEQE